jgi:hypothetical protein
MPTSQKLREVEIMACYRIQFLPEGRETTVEQGSTLLETARTAVHGVSISAWCFY